MGDASDLVELMKSARSSFGSGVPDDVSVEEVPYRERLCTNFKGFGRFDILKGCGKK